MSDLLDNATCLVTGGTGFLGRCVVERLAADGSRVTVLTRGAPQSPEVLCGDLASGQLDLAGARFHTVYHVAGLAHTTPRTDEQRRRFFEVNTQGTRNLLTALERSARLPEAFVLISTVAVYGLEEGSLLDESTARAAQDPYGASKRQAEDLAADWAARRGVRLGVVRLPLVAGQGAPGNLGAMVRALAKHRYAGMGSGDARRSMVMADEVASILPAIARVGGTFHLTDGHHPSFAELEEALCHALGRRPPMRLPMAVARLGAWTGDALQRITGWKPPLTTPVLSKMTRTLTFSDAAARRLLGWNPTRVIDHADELVVQGTVHPTTTSAVTSGAAAELAALSR